MLLQVLFPGGSATPEWMVIDLQGAVEPRFPSAGAGERELSLDGILIGTIALSAPKVRSAAACRCVFVWLFFAFHGALDASFPLLFRPSNALAAAFVLFCLKSGWRRFCWRRRSRQDRSHPSNRQPRSHWLRRYAPETARGRRARAGQRP